MRKTFYVLARSSGSGFYTRFVDHAEMVEEVSRIDGIGQNPVTIIPIHLSDDVIGEESFKEHVRQAYQAIREAEEGEVTLVSTIVSAVVEAMV